jgi:hypothetical protein
MACPVETQLVKEWMKDYMTELDVDPECRSDMILINKLVELDILDYRTSLGFSGSYDEEAITVLKTTIIDNGQSTTEQVSVHPLLDAKEKIQRMRERILESLTATRREKYKKAAALGTQENKDVSQHLAALKKALNSSSGRGIGATLEEVKKNAKEVAIDETVEADWEEFEDK